MERFLWEEFRGDITFLLGTVPADGEQLKDFGSRIGELSRTLHAEKQRKQFWLFQEGPERWILPLKGDVCPVCQRDETERNLEPDEEGNRRCPQCQRFEAIGQWIPRTYRLIRSFDRLEGQRVVPFEPLGIYWRLDATQHVNSRETLEHVVSYRLVDSTNLQCDFLEDTLRDTWAYSFELLANNVPMQDNAVVEFSELAARNPAGFLGILRMDVDNLGGVFSFGLTRSDRSLSRMATLSRTFDLFFSGYLNQMVGPQIYVTYAGGDDLFLVGSWEAIIDVASQIQQEFTAYCCENPHLHLSGGVYLCKGKFPIARAAPLAGEKLNSVAKAKADSRRGDAVDKNSLAVLEIKVPWDTFHHLKQFADKRLIPAIESGEISRRFFYTLLQLYHQHLDPELGDERGHLVWVPKFFYILARNVKSSELRMELQQRLLELKDWLPVLVGYVSLKTRNRERITQTEV